MTEQEFNTVTTATTIGFVAGVTLMALLCKKQFVKMQRESENKTMRIRALVEYAAKTLAVNPNMREAAEDVVNDLTFINLIEEL